MKKAMSLILALAMCLALAVTAGAAYEIEWNTAIYETSNEAVLMEVDVPVYNDEPLVLIPAKNDETGMTDYIAPPASNPTTASMASVLIAFEKL